jgi:hypothetical protein
MGLLQRWGFSAAPCRLEEVKQTYDNNIGESNKCPDTWNALARELLNIYLSGDIKPVSKLYAKGTYNGFTLYSHIRYVRFEVFTALTMKNGVFGDVTPCGSCKN